MPGSTAHEQGRGIPLSLARETGDPRLEESKFDDMMALQEERITVTFVLPDDSTIAHEFKKGQTVQVLKAFLKDDCELNLTDLELYLDDKLMLDPFSLTDFPVVERATTLRVNARIARRK